MNKVFQLIFATATLVSAQAQSFAFIADSLERQTNAPGMISFRNKVVNTSAAALNLLIIRNNLYLPAEWVSSLCIGITCYAPASDTIRFEELGPGETLDVAVDLQTDENNGFAKVNLAIEVDGKPLDAIHTDFVLYLGPKSATLPARALQRQAGSRLRISGTLPGRVSLDYGLKEGGARVRCRIYAVSGKLVASLTDALSGAGSCHAEWDGRNDFGAQVGPGVYTAVLTAGRDPLSAGRIVIR